MVDLSAKSLEILNSYDHDKLGQMTESEFVEYIQMSSMLGNKYMYHGKQKGIDIEEFQNDFMFFGTTVKRLVQKENGTWVISQGVGLLPQFDIRPVMLDEEHFRQKMLELGVPEKTLDEYFAYVPNYDNF
jgi:hypothetical protein